MAPGAARFGVGKGRVGDPCRQMRGPLRPGGRMLRPLNLRPVLPSA